MRPSLLLLVVVFGVLADALVHQIPVRQQKVPTHTRAYKHRVAKQMAMMKKTMGEEHFHHFKSLLASQGKTSIDFRDLVGEIQLGTPAQTFSALFVDWEQDVYVIDPNASGVTGSRARYDASASSTSKPDGRDFTTLWGDTNGHIVNDVITIGGIQAPVNLGVADQVTYYSDVNYYDVDALFGLLMHKDNSFYPDTNTSVLAQLADTVLDQPIVTVLIRDSDDGVVTIGGLDVTNCEASYAQAPKYRSSSGNVWDSLNLTSVSIGSYSQSSISTAEIQAHRYLKSIYVGYAILYAIVDATGATSSSDDWYSSDTPTYYVDCSKLSSLPVLTLTLDNDVQLAVTSDDYVSVQSDGTCVLAVTTFTSDTDNIYLGQPFLRNHCASNDFENNILGFSRVNPIAA